MKVLLHRHSSTGTEKKLGLWLGLLMETTSSLEVAKQF